MNWQSVIAGIIVILAATWLVRRFLRIFGGGKGQVSSCGTCTKNREVGDQKQIVELGKRKDS